MRKLFQYSVGGVLALCAAFGLSWLAYMPDVQERGAWRLETGGAVLDLTPFRATLYSETGHSCLSVMSFPAHLKLVELIEGASVSVIDGQLYLNVDGSLAPTRWSKLGALPNRCTDPDPSTATARDIFDATWAALDEHYAFFDLHGVDWDARRANAPDPGGETPVSDDDVTAMLLDLTAGLDDGHLHFGTDQLGYASPSVGPAWVPQDGSLTRADLNQIALNNAGTQLAELDTAPIFYGLRDDGIGYISVQQMDVAVPFGGNSARAMADAFAQVLDALSEAKALVIDVRFNPGGSDTVSFGIAGHFIDAPLNAFTKTTRSGETQTAPFTAVVMPADQTPYTRPVVLLTSNLTGSAAEILTLALREVGHVTVLGEPTAGGLSDVMGVILPNGWGLGLSNQTYLAMDGSLFEGRGVPPDIAVPFDGAAYLAGRDPVLAAGFQAAHELAQE